MVLGRLLVQWGLTPRPPLHHVERGSRTAAMAVRPGRPPGRMVVLAICGVVAVVVIAGVTAIVAPPNTYDSMTYHLPRVMHWIQHQSVGHYPTHIPRQLHFPPGLSSS